MLRLNVDLSERSDGESTDSLASGGQTPRREKQTPEGVESQRPMTSRKPRPRSPLPYTRGRYASGSNQSRVSTDFLPPKHGSPGKLIRVHLSKFSDVDALLSKISTSVGRTLPTLEDEAQNVMMTKRIKVKRAQLDASDVTDDDVITAPPAQRADEPQPASRQASSSSLKQHKRGMASPVHRRDVLPPISPASNSQHRQSSRKTRSGRRVSGRLH